MATKKTAQNATVVSGNIEKELKKTVSEAKTKKADKATAEKAKTVDTKKTKAKKTAEKTTVETKPSTAKKTTAKKSVEVYVQYLETEIKTDELVEKAKEIFVAEGNKKSDAKDIKVYIKPEEKMVYFVINQEFNGSFAME